MNALDFMDRPIAFHRVFVTKTGSVNAALMLSQAIYWSNRTKDPDGWFYKTAIDWEKETGLTRREQDTARKLLADIMEEKLAGMPATTHFRVTSPRLREWLGNNSRSSLAESAKLDWRKTPNKIGGKRQSTNISESTSETTNQNARAKPRDAGSLDWVVNKPAISAQADRISQIYHRRKNTPWSEKEVAAWKKLTKNGPLDDDELSMVERYYTSNRKKQDNICRRDLLTFLNHYGGEVDRARAWCEKHPLPGERKIKAAVAKPEPEPSGPMPDQNDPGTIKFVEEFERRQKRLPAGWTRITTPGSLDSTLVFNGTDGAKE